MIRPQTITVARWLGALLFVALLIVVARQPDGRFPGWIGSVVVGGLAVFAVWFVAFRKSAAQRAAERKAEERGRFTDHTDGAA